jgi:sugar/nucleoside kinase (ribokinase family)
VDALVRIDDDGLLEELDVPRGRMTPVDHHRWHAVYERVHGLGVEVHSGGSCANALATLGLLGADVNWCGQVGDDPFGARYAQSLSSACGRHALRLAPGRVTGKCLSLISRTDGERTMLTDLGTSIELADISHVEDEIRSARVLHLTGYEFLGGAVRESVFRAIALAEEAGIPISLDLADPFVARTIREDCEWLLRDHADIAFLNREEAEVMTGLGAHAAVARLREWTDTVVVKLGGEGSLVAAGHHVAHVPAFPVQVADTTGAGDSYAGGYLYGWLQGLAPERCGELGSRVASLVVAQVGAVCRDREGLLAARSAVLA